MTTYAKRVRLDGTVHQVRSVAHAGGWTTCSVPYQHEDLAPDISYKHGSSTLPTAARADDEHVTCIGCIAA